MTYVIKLVVTVKGYVVADESRRRKQTFFILTSVRGVAIQERSGGRRHPGLQLGLQWSPGFEGFSTRISNVTSVHARGAVSIIVFRRKWRCEAA